jgi:hypothetical protein
VAPQTAIRKVFLDRVMDPFRRDRHLSHSNLVSIINGRSAAERQQQHRGDSRLFTSDTVGDTRAVVIWAGRARGGDPGRSNTDFWEEVLSLPANLTGAILIGANLSGADLAGADLTGADLTGADATEADLGGAVLSGVRGVETLKGFKPSLGRPKQ